MDKQGYPIKTTTFYQDNMSAQRMEKNGKASCGQRSRHINIQYFYITDQSKQNKITITHCPTTEMLGDFFTKPLQGNLFRKFRSVFLGHAHISTLKDERPERTEERVEEQMPIGNPPMTYADVFKQKAQTTSPNPMDANDSQDSESL